MAISVYIGEVDRSAWFDKRTIVVEDTFGARGKTAHATITVDTNAGAPPTRPLAGQVFRVVIDGTEEFEGPIVTVTDHLFNPDVYEAEVAAEDYTKWLDRKLVSAKIARPSELAGDRIKFFLSKFCLDFTEGTINDGDTVPSQAYDYVEMSAIMDELSEACGYTWWADSDKQVHFVPEVTEVAPIAAVDLDTELQLGDITVTEDWSDLHNVLILKDFKRYSEEYYSYEKKADGIQSFFGLPYEPWSVATTQVRSVNTEGTTKTWTVKEDESVIAGETDFIGVPTEAYLCLSNWGVRFGKGDKPGEDEIVYVDFAYTLQDQDITVTDGASVTEMQSRTGTNGEFEKMISSPNLKATSNDTALHFAQMILARGAWPVVRGSFNTFLSGWKSGQTFTITSAKRSIAEVKPPNVGDPIRVWVQSVTKQVVVLADGESVRCRSDIEFSNKPFSGQMLLEEFLKRLIDSITRNQPPGDVTITSTTTSTTSTSTTTTSGTSTSTTTTLADRAVLLEPATPDFTTSTSTSTSTITTSTSTTMTGTSTTTSTTSLSTSTTTTLAPAWTSPAFVSFSCGESAGAATNFIDGDTGTYWSHNVDESHEIILDMATTRTIEKVRMYVYSLGASQWTDLDVYVSADALVWEYAGPAAFVGGVYGAEWAEKTLLTPRTGRYIKLVNIVTQVANHYLLGAEFEAYLTG